MDPDRTRPLWRQIAAEIIGRIEAGTYPPGGRVPSALEIAQEFGVVNAPAAKAMRRVREQGYTRAAMWAWGRSWWTRHRASTADVPPVMVDAT